MFRYSPQNIIHPSLTPSYVLLPQSPTSYLLIFSSFDFFSFSFGSPLQEADATER